MADLIVEAPRTLEQRLRAAGLPPGVVVVEPADGGEVVMSVLSPEGLVREPDELHRVLDRAGTGDAPLVVEVEAAEELRPDELDVILGAARRSPRPVILRIAADASA
jgi:hypothetical protein